MKGGRFLTWVTLSVALSCVILLPVVQAQIQPPQTPGAAALTTAPENVFPTVRLFAATAEQDGKTEVRLRWTVDDGWLPEGGFNLYRTEGENRTKLNSSPIAPSSQASGETINISPRNQLNLGQMLATAGSLPAGLEGTRLRLFGEPTLRPPSSATVFDAIRQQSAALSGLSGPALLDKSKTSGILNNPVIGDYTKRLVPKVAPVGPGAPPGQPAPAASVGATSLDQVKEARLNLLLGAVLYRGVGDTLGLAFTDNTAVNGATYTYTLSMLDSSGQESDAATTTITVGADPQPPVPTGLEALQRDADTVDLRWERVSESLENALGVSSYNITRVDGTHPQGIRLNDMPVLIADIPTDSGPVEPAVFFADSNASPGQITYQVTLSDAFGRESAPGSVDFVMEDWHTPPPVQVAQAELIGNDVRVLWSSSTESDACYRVYRLATDQYLTFTPSLLTPQPITPQPVDVVRLLLNEPPGRASSLVAALCKLDDAKTLGLGMQWQELRERFNQLSQRDKDQVTQKVQATAAQKLPTGLLSFIDAAVPRDHYYIYMVTALYTRNNLDSPVTQTTVVPVPNLVKPSQPVGLTCEFAPGEAKPTAAPQPAATSTTIATKPAVSAPEAIGAVQAAEEGGQEMVIIETPPPDCAGIVTLKWQPGTGGSPVSRYRIYRANATKFTYVATSVGSSGGTASASGSGTSAKSGMGVESGAQFTAPAVAPAVSITKLYKLTKQETDIPDSSYGLVGDIKPTAKDTTTGWISFADYVTHSNAHYYAYRVVPVNRWGIQGDKVDTSIRVPATMPPTVPVVTTVYPDNEGNVTVDIGQNPEDEEIVQYRIMRKTISAPAAYVAAPAAVSPAGTSGGFRQSVPALSGAAGQAIGASTAPPVSAAASAVDRLGPGAERFGVARRTSSAAVLAEARGQMATIPSELAREFMDTGQEAGLASESDRLASGVLTFADDFKNADPREGYPYKNQYLYRVVAEDSDSLLSNASEPLDATPNKVRPDRPENPTATYDGTAAKLQWKAPEDAVGYIVERATGASADFAQISGIIKETSLTDYSVFPGNSYTYAIRALDSIGNLSDPAQPEPSVTVPTPPETARPQVAEAAPQTVTQPQPGTVVTPPSWQITPLPGPAISTPAPAIPAQPITGPLPGPVTPLPGTITPQPTPVDATFVAWHTACESNPIDFALRSAEFTISRAWIGNSIYVPAIDEKLLVVYFTLRNPQAADRYVQWGTLRFSAVDSSGNAWDSVTDTGIDPTARSLDMVLTPHQSINLYTLFTVPANGDIATLLVKDEENAVVSYDFSGKAKLAEAFASDPNDPAGVTALPEIPIQVGTYYPTGLFDYRMESAAYSDSPIRNELPDKGYRYMVFTFSLRNGCASDQAYGDFSFDAMLRLSSGENIGWNRWLLSETSDEAAEGTLAPGQEVRLRIYFETPKAEAATSLRFRERDGRVFISDLSSLQQPRIRAG